MFSANENAAQQIEPPAGSMSPYALHYWCQEASLLKDNRLHLVVACLARQLVWVYFVLLMSVPTSTQLLAATTVQLDNARVQAIAWLLSNQQGDGSWRSGKGSEIQTTVNALMALANAGVAGPTYTRGLAWLANAEAYSVDALARQIQMMSAAGLDTTEKIAKLLSLRNRQSAWGTYDRYSTSFPDTPLASSAIRTDNATYLAERGRLLKAMCQIVLAQKGDGSWSYGATSDAALLSSDSGAILSTTYNVQELATFVNLGFTTRTCAGTSYNFTAVVNAGLSWLVSQRLRADGGFSEPATQGGVGTVLETALVYNTLNALAPSDPRLVGAQDFLINNQDVDGAWQGDALATAVAVTTLPAVALSDTDQDGIPDQVESVLGTNPLVFDSRVLATGNGQSVAGVNKAYGFTTNLSQSSIFDIPTLVGAALIGSAPSSWVISQGQLPDGMFINASSGFITGTPASSGTYSFVVSAVNSVTGQTDEFVLRVAVNAPPVIEDPGAQASLEGTTVNVAISATDAEGNALSYVTTGLPVGLAIDAMTGIISGSLDYVSAGSYNVVVSVSDRASTTTLNIPWTVVNLNRAPVAVMDIVTTTQDTPVAVSVLSNDSDADGDLLIVTSVSQPVNGAVSVSTGGTFVYTPATGYVGTDSFTYKISDGVGGVANGVVLVTVVSPPVVAGGDINIGAILMIVQQIILGSTP